jgi:hypothetical protein
VLVGFIKAALDESADSLEFEYAVGKLLVMGFQRHEGFGIASVESKSKDCERLVDEIIALKKKARVAIGGTTWRVYVSEYEAFGEVAWRLQFFATPTKTK